MSGRVASSGELASVQPKPDIHKQFPLHCDIIKSLIRSSYWKVILCSHPAAQVSASTQLGDSETNCIFWYLCHMRLSKGSALRRATTGDLSAKKCHQKILHYIGIGPNLPSCFLR